MLLYTRLAAPKEPKKRSRGGMYITLTACGLDSKPRDSTIETKFVFIITNSGFAGCIFCKEKKKKCDEGRPKCSRCAENGVDCTYGAVKPRQRRRRESAPLTSNAALESALGLYSSSRRLSQASCYSQGSTYTLWGDDGRRRAFESSLDDCPLFSPTENFFGAFSLGGFSVGGNQGILGVHPQDEDTTHGDEYYLDTATVEAEEVVAEEPGAVALAPRANSLAPDLAMIAPCPTASPLRGFVTPVFSEFSDRPNRRALVDHFCNVLSHLIVFREETGNPFQQLVLPLTTKSSPVLNAIFALASAHLEYRGIQTPEKALYFHNRAIQGVAQMIQQNDKVNRTEILAAIMLLVYYECLVQNGGSSIIAGHLKGALTIMCMDNTTTSDSEGLPPPPDPASVFLERAFCFYDVINALSNGTAPLSAAPTPGCLLPFSPLGAPAASPLCNVDTLLGMATTLWPIIHRLSGLAGLKTDLNNATREAGSSPTKAAVLRAEFASTAQAIESALLLWQPVLPSNFSPDIELADDHTPPLVSDDNITEEEATKQIQSIYHNAMAYRHASLVYLYKTILQHPTSHPLVQKHAELTLKHCVRTVGFKGPMSALLWPLFVASCEALTGKDREVAKKVFGEIEKRQGMKNIGTAWDVVREVWKRVDGLSSSSSSSSSVSSSVQTNLTEEDRDAVVGGAAKENEEEKEEEEEIWRVVSREMGVSIVFG
ncbi:hypothetical protein QBC35DRAFT_116068 [Podospora australis]|uniref:Zn(2)-C6 fungal-type domain-containing protein n=1 Tax=Podospora australis TaxID=1536484 RepID=A0AAN6WYG5_9PEZI|nr:hypothetical protein QBC35DRAFT_116068 [Podospora australis]